MPQCHLYGNNDRKEYRFQQCAGNNPQNAHAIYDEENHDQTQNEPTCEQSNWKDAIPLKTRKSTTIDRCIVPYLKKVFFFCIILNLRKNGSSEIKDKALANTMASNFDEYYCEYDNVFYHNTALNESIDDSTISDMDCTLSLSKKEHEATRLLEQSRALWKFAKIFGVASVLLVLTVFGFDPTIFEEIATLLVHNVLAASILISGFNIFTTFYNALSKPVPGTPIEPSSTPLQGLVRASTQVSSLDARRFKRPPSIVLPRKKSKSSSGGLFSGLWPKSKSKRSSKQPKQAKNVATRRRGWPSGRL